MQGASIDTLGEPKRYLCFVGCAEHRLRCFDHDQLRSRFYTDWRSRHRAEIPTEVVDRVLPFHLAVGPAGVRDEVQTLLDFDRLIIAGRNLAVAFA